MAQPSASAIDLDDARDLARRAHAGQTRRHGAPYAQHPLDVQTLVDDLGFAAGIEVDDETRAVAILHDVVEDCGIDEATLAQRFGAEVARRVGLLSKPPRVEGDAGRDERYMARLQAHADDRLRLVKVSDRVHNLSELHLAPDRAKLRAYVDQTLRHVLPLARGASRPPVAAALAAAVEDGARAACRAQGEPLPEALRGDDGRVPRGLYAVLTPRGAPDDVVAALAPVFEAAVAGGAALVQIRLKGLDDRRVLEILEAFVPVAKKRGVPLVVNDRADLALAAGADGVHVGRTDIPPAHARAILGERALVGTSTHSLDEVEAARAEGGLDHLAFGPIYASPTKQGHADPTGLEALASVVARVDVPVVAIGGIVDARRMAEVASAGAALGAVVSALIDAPDPRFSARRLALSHAAAFAARSAR